MAHPPAAALRRSSVGLWAEEARCRSSWDWAARGRGQQGHDGSRWRGGRGRGRLAADLDIRGAMLRRVPAPGFDDFSGIVVSAKPCLTSSGGRSG